MLSAKEQSLLDALEGQAADHGVEIVTVEVVGSKKSPTIRVYIDAPGGVGFDELSTSQQWINELMDKIDPFPGAYTLEVSSPGIDRPLRTLGHFLRSIGETAVIHTAAPIDGRAKWTGVVVGVEGGLIALDTGEEVVKIDYDTVRRANVKGAVDFSSRSLEERNGHG